MAKKQLANSCQQNGTPARQKGHSSVPASIDGYPCRQMYVILNIFQV